MLVYGDPRFHERLSVLAAELGRRVEEANAEELEELRPLAIQAGQLEQGLSDFHRLQTSPNRPVLSLTATVSDLLAEAFCQAWAKAAGLRIVSLAHTSQELLRKAAQALAEIDLEEDPELTIKIPEGFEFYALFPEQYCASAQKWAVEHGGTWPRRALVVGIRSIGTTLSAAVKASLQAAGWQADRVTVRPSGHPFQRKLAWEQSTRPLPRCALIVDEGPGLSGSSMAAAAQALAEAGVEDISFFPGHGGEPGSAASVEVRRWWQKAPRYLTALEDLRWNGWSLKESLARRCDGWQVTGDKPPDLTSRVTRHPPLVTDMSGGLWRQWAYAREPDWPAVCATFERMKFKSENGDGHSVLWKFSGLGCALKNGGRSGDSQKAAELAAENWAPAPLGTCRGFVGMRWVEGTRLQADDRKAVIDHLGKYLARVMGAPLATDMAHAAVARLAEMLYWNTREALGEEMAERCRGWAEGVAEFTPGPSYGDGHMGPWEWIRTPSGQLIKTDSTGHTVDHTLVGEQSVLWDVAGTLVEWGLEASTASPLLCPLLTAGVRIDKHALLFHELAYAAFRMGMTALGASQLAEEDLERKRLLRACDYYRERLKTALLTNSPKQNSFRQKYLETEK